MTRTILRYALAAAILTAGPAALVSAKVDMKAVLADAGRPEADKVRDENRKPAELVAFSGVREGSKVAELGPGGGYFTRILTGAVGPKGHVYAMVGRPSPVLEEYAASHKNLSVVAIQPGEVKVSERWMSCGRRSTIMTSRTTR